MTPLRILTLNTWKGDGHYRARLAWLLAELGPTTDPLRPDVLALQEVFEARTADTARALAYHLEMNWRTAPARQKIRLFENKETDSSSGLAVLARGPGPGQTVRALPMDKRDGERLAQYVPLTVSGRSVLIINTHLTHLRGASALRQAQLAALLEPLEPAEGQGIRFDGQLYPTVLLCGDFNAETHSPEIQFLLKHPTLSVRDTYAAVNGNTPAVTMPRRCGQEPFGGAGIDFIFSVACGPAQHPTVAEARVVLTRPDADGHYPSDHAGVLIEIHLP